MRVVDASAIPLTDAGLVKMEDRKRPASYDNSDSAPPLKRQATSINGGSKLHPDADMPWKDDIERFQKEAIWRQMQEYKREKNTLESRLTEIAKKARDHDDQLRAVDSWFKQLIDEVRILTQPSSSLKPATQQTSFPTSLLFADNETFTKHLRYRSKEIKATISTLFANAVQTPPEVTDLQARLTELLAQEKTTIAELEQANAEKEAMQERLEGATLRYLSAEKRLDRAKSGTVAKLETQLKMSSQSGGVDDTLSEGKEESLAVNGVAEKPTDITESREEYRRVVAVSDKQKEQLERLAVENEQLTEKIRALNMKATKLTDDDYASTDLFKLVKSQHEDIIKRINHLEATNIHLREEAKKLQAERTDYRTKLQNEVQQTIAEKELQLTKTENDLVRIRNARDELVSDLNRKKAAEETEKSFSTRMKELNGAHEETIKALQTEAERLRLLISQGEPSTSTLEDMSVEELRSKYNVLEQSSSMLNSEVASMTAALRRTSAIASQKVMEIGAYEEKFLRLTADKAKAVEKYFTAMKYKESTEQEVRTLKAQGTKASDVVSQLKEAETQTKALITNLENQVAVMKESLNTVTSQCRASQQQATERQISIDGLKSQISKLEKLVIDKDEALASAKNSHLRTEREVEELKSTLLDKQRDLELVKVRNSGSKNSDQDLRKYVICTNCNVNIKDTLIKTCGHVLCKPCVEERQSSRSRRCPSCNKSFGANDYTHIHL